MAPAMAKPLLEKAVGDYEHALAVQEPTFAGLGDHAKGELLFGLAEGYGRLGDAAKARQYFDRLIADASGSGHAPQAREFVATGTLPKVTGAGCVGCHQ
jgi:tetratricopeptide (TPR) repeat protein